MATFSFTAGIEHARNNPGTVLRTEALPGWVVYLIANPVEPGWFTLRVAEAVPDGLERGMTWNHIDCPTVVQIIAALVTVTERHGDPVEMDEFDRIALANPDLIGN